MQKLVLAVFILITSCPRHVLLQQQSSAQPQGQTGMLQHASQHQKGQSDKLQQSASQPQGERVELQHACTFLPLFKELSCTCSSINSSASLLYSHVKIKQEVEHLSIHNCSQICLSLDLEGSTNGNFTVSVRNVQHLLLDTFHTSHSNINIKMMDTGTVVLAGGRSTAIFQMETSNVENILIYNTTLGIIPTGGIQLTASVSIRILDCQFLSPKSNSLVLQSGGDIIVVNNIFNREPLDVLSIHNNNSTRLYISCNKHSGGEENPECLNLSRSFIRESHSTGERLKEIVILSTSGEKAEILLGIYTGVGIILTIITVVGCAFCFCVGRKRRSGPKKYSLTLEVGRKEADGDYSECKQLTPSLCGDLAPTEVTAGHEDLGSSRGLLAGKSAKPNPTPGARPEELGRNKLFDQQKCLHNPSMPEFYSPKRE